MATTSVAGEGVVREVVTRGAPPEQHGTTQPRGARHQSRAPRSAPPRWLHAAVVTLSLLPLLYVLAAIASDFFQGTRLLGSNPIKEAEHFTGKWAVRFLVLTLSVTPAVRELGRGWLVRYRRTFGLLAFAYAVTHLLIYAVLDVELTWSDMLEDVAERIYITIGMTALVLLIPLAVTSTKGWIRRLGNRRWTAIHRLVYVSSVLGVIHFWMAVKQDITEPLVYATLFALLLGWRAWRWWRGARAPSAAAGVRP